MKTFIIHQEYLQLKALHFLQMKRQVEVEVLAVLFASQQPGITEEMKHNKVILWSNKRKLGS